MVGLGSSFLHLVVRTVVLPPPSGIILASVWLLWGWVEVAGEFALYRYLAQLAARIPDDHLAGRAITLMWGYGVSVGLLLTMSGLTGIIIAVGGTRALTRSGVMGAFGCFGAVGAIAWLV